LAQPDFAAYSAGNPVVPKGSSGAWDENATWAPRVAVINDTFYLTYNGTSSFETVPIAIGLATSPDGFTFTKCASNPVLHADGSGFDSFNVMGGQLFYDDGTWYMYYSGRSVPHNQPGNVIGRATAGNPRGPWTTPDDTLLTVGSAGEWDSEFVEIESIISTDMGLGMYYWGGNAWPGGVHQIGLATSNDGGLTWIKYNDPATTNPPYAESDPVLSLGKAGSYDDSGIYGCSVLKKATQWDMFYAGHDGNSTSICYATSVDGIVWYKNTPKNPIFTAFQDPNATSVVEVPAVVLLNDTYFLYYDYGVFGTGIGLATADTITSLKQSSNDHPATFELYQNYPNPFNPKTNIKFQIPNSEFVNLSIYNLLGQKVATLVNERKKVGYHQVEWDATEFASGMYYYQLSTDEGFARTKKLLLIK
jgi:predicted GH43/DUF377 family glycosyl hydrolase